MFQYFILVASIWGIYTSREYNLRYIMKITNYEIDLKNQYNI